MEKRCFAVQFVIEDERSTSGFDSAQSFINDMEEILGWEDFTDYKILSVDHADVWEGEAVKKIKVVRSDDQFLHQEEEN
tara:strand:+ start:438 stop:674 length:237 start_codon:yes stop_codon:yes gene_type:complete